MLRRAADAGVLLAAAALGDLFARGSEAGDVPRSAPEARRWHRAAAERGWAPERLRWEAGVAEALPLADASADLVVATLVLCSVADVPRAAAEAARVLRPGGRLLFIEHTAARGAPFLRLKQAILDPLQQLLADGCHLCRDPLPAIEAAFGGAVEAERLAVPGQGLIGPHVAGIATRA